MPLLSSEINVLEKVCNKASKIIIRDFGEIEKLQVSKKGPGDFVTKTDKKVEQIIIEELEKARPGFNILAEEGGTAENKSEYTWIIDPIDGTTNFMHGIPHFAISIGLEKNGEVIAGIIFDPIKNEMFYAEKGRGEISLNSILRGCKQIFCDTPTHFFCTNRLSSVRSIDCRAQIVFWISSSWCSPMGQKVPQRPFCG